MKTYQIKIIMHDGSVGQHIGQYTDCFDAVIHAIDAFPEAARISAKAVQS